MDYLRWHIGLDQTRVEFHEYGEPVTVMPSPTKTLQHENPINVKVLKTMSVSEETRRSGKNRVRHRVFVRATDGKGKMRIGIKMDGVQKMPLTRLQHKQTQRCSTSILEFSIRRNHTLTHQVHGKYDGIEVTRIPALKGTGLECSPMVNFILCFIGIKDCIAMPEYSDSNFWNILNTPSFVDFKGRTLKCKYSISDNSTFLITDILKGSEIRWIKITFSSFEQNYALGKSLTNNREYDAFAI